MTFETLDIFYVKSKCRKYNYKVIVTVLEMDRLLPWTLLDTTRTFT